MDDNTLNGTPADEGNENPTFVTRYPFYLPNSDLNEKLDPPQPFDHVDPGTRANPAKPNLLTPNAIIDHLSPYIGTEISGVQLSTLTSEGLDELALYAAERKVLIFRDQDWKDLKPERQLEIVRHFGPLHRNPLGANVKGYPEYHIVYKNSSIPGQRPNPHLTSHTAVKWHVDSSFERQPAGLTFFWLLEQPPVGGDTLYLSLVEAYNRLSPTFRSLLERLRVRHRSISVKGVPPGRPDRMPPVISEHPLVRVHPVTGEKALFVNELWDRDKDIVGFKPEESKLLHGFLLDHIAKCADIQIRAKHREGTVVIWDNRVVAHSLMADYLDKPHIRLGVRLAAHAEVPIPADPTC